MRLARLICLIGILGCTVGIRSQQAKVHPPAVRNCDEVSNSRPGMGHGYTGLVTNEDYDFTAHLPSGLTGWGGVAETAPFHGFTIFLDSKKQSCILFEVHIRVDESGSEIHSSKTRNLHLGKADAWQTVHVGMKKNEQMNNIKTSFTFKQANQIDDGVILLVTPTSKMPESKQIYEEFLKSVVFGH